MEREHLVKAMNKVLHKNFHDCLMVVEEIVSVHGNDVDLMFGAGLFLQVVHEDFEIDFECIERAMDNYIKHVVDKSKHAFSDYEIVRPSEFDKYFQGDVCCDGNLSHIRISICKLGGEYHSHSYLFAIPNDLTLDLKTWDYMAHYQSPEGGMKNEKRKDFDPDNVTSVNNFFQSGVLMSESELSEKLDNEDELLVAINQQLSFDCNTYEVVDCYYPQEEDEESATRFVLRYKADEFSFIGPTLNGEDLTKNDVLDCFCEVQKDIVVEINKRLKEKHNEY